MCKRYEGEGWWRWILPHHIVIWSNHKYLWRRMLTCTKLFEQKNVFLAPFHHFIYRDQLNYMRVMIRILLKYFSQSLEGKLRRLLHGDVWWKIWIQILRSLHFIKRKSFFFLPHNDHISHDVGYCHEQRRRKSMKG